MHAQVHICLDPWVGESEPSLVFHTVVTEGEASGHLWVGDDTTIWSRSPERLRSLAAALLEAADKLEEAAQATRRVRSAA
jgi:hypothetical protein